MAASVTLTIPTERFQRMKGALTDTSGPLEVVARYVTIDWMPALFSSSGLGTWPAVARGGPPLLDSGILSRAFNWSLGIDRTSVVIQNPMKYAKLQNFGGTVTAKSGKYLAIPLPTLSKTDRHKSPREFKNTFFAKSRNGNLILFEKTDTARLNFQGKRKKAEGGIRPLFVMKESVTIKARPFMKWYDAMKVEAYRRASEAIAKAVRAA
jgi:phage gpG-like protein